MDLLYVVSCRAHDLDRKSVVPSDWNMLSANEKTHVIFNSCPDLLFGAALFLSGKRPRDQDPRIAW